MIKTLKHSLPDGLHIRLMYFHVRKQILYLKNPETYSHKIQWLKLYGDLEQFTDHADKYTVRQYVVDKVGNQYLVPLIGVWNKFDDIPLKSLPDKYVMKATHGSGYNIIVNKKDKFKPDQMKQKIEKWMSENYFEVSRETQYKNSKPRVIVEKYIEDDNDDLKDYKFYCFKGKPELIMVATDRQSNLKLDVVDANWKRVKATIGKYPNSTTLPSKPSNLKDMVDLAKKLSEDFPFVRVDLYTAKNKIYFGELTFTPSSGLEIFGDKEFDKWLGKKIDLSAYKQVGV